MAKDLALIREGTLPSQDEARVVHASILHAIHAVSQSKSYLICCVMRHTVDLPQQNHLDTIVCERAGHPSVDTDIVHAADLKEYIHNAMQ